MFETVSHEQKYQSTHWNESDVQEYHYEEPSILILSEYSL